MPNRKHTNICLVESRWWPSRNTSVRGVFEVLSDLHSGSHNGYEYEMANSRESFQEIVLRQISNPQCNYLSIATHGSEFGLSLFNEDGVSRAVIRNTLKDDDERNLVGVHFGCCSFLTQEIAAFLYNEDISPWWVAGYGQEVSWVESTSLDFIFFNKILKYDRRLRAEPLRVIEKVSKEIQKECNGLIDKLQFQIYIKDAQGNIVPMLRIRA